MTNKDRILAVLTTDEICDDCLSEISHVSPRQTVYQICTKLSNASEIMRCHGTCERCGKGKLVSRLYDNAPVAPVAKSRSERPISKKVLQFHISLLDVEPAVWRRFTVPETISMKRFHDIIQIVMGWENSHLFEFRYGPMRIMLKDEFFYGTPDPMMFDATKKKLSSLELKPNDALTYIYDMGDDWAHLLRFEGVAALQDGEQPVACLDGARACPPEDIGGPPGYQHLVEVMKKGRGTEYHDMVAWLGHPYHAEAFDREAANKILQSFSQKVTEFRARNH